MSSFQAAEMKVLRCWLIFFWARNSCSKRVWLVSLGPWLHLMTNLAELFFRIDWNYHRRFILVFEEPVRFPCYLFLTFLAHVLVNQICLFHFFLVTSSFCLFDDDFQCQPSSNEEKNGGPKHLVAQCGSKCHLNHVRITGAKWSRVAMQKCLQLHFPRMWRCHQQSNSRVFTSMRQR